MNSLQVADVVIIPASQINAEHLTHWYQWLEDKMTEKGLRVLRPEFPGGDLQTFDTWMAVMTKHEKEIGDNTIIVGHSLGGILLARWLETHVVGAAVFVAAPYKEERQLWSRVPSRPSKTSGFFTRAPDWAEIRSHARIFRLFYGDKDILIPSDHAETYSRELRCNVTWILSGGHLDEMSGFTEFTSLADQIMHIHGELSRDIHEGKRREVLT